MHEVYPRLSVEEAQARILATVHVLEAEPTPILEALGRTLAEDVYAERDIPPLSNTAMDGYAVRAADTAGATADKPVKLQVVADLAAGYLADRVVTPGTAIRIMTGAPIPEGADTVVPFEQTDQGSEWVAIQVEAAVGDNIRYAGEDVRGGELILRRGVVIRPQEIGMMAALGRGHVATVRRPRVGILATGDEVIDVDAPWQPGKIRNANTYSNAAQVIKYGGVPVILGIAHDDVDAITGCIREGLAQGIDLLLTSGGISVGDFDVVKKVLSTEGQMDFWQVKMRPGKPFAFGRIGEVPLLGLPGNPVSVMVSFENFARPAILKMLGQTDLRPQMIRATLLDDAHTSDRFRFYLRVMVERTAEGYTARLTGEQGSGILLSMVQAQGFALIPEGVADVPAGNEVDVMLFDCPPLADDGDGAGAE
jgi:molybdopterin molybdotransferase